MPLDVLVWLVIGLAALVTEVTGLLGLHGFRPLTLIVRGLMRRSSMVTGLVAAFLLWLVYHFLVQTWLPGQSVPVAFGLIAGTMEGAYQLGKKHGTVTQVQLGHPDMSEDELDRLEAAVRKAIQP